MTNVIEVDKILREKKVEPSAAAMPKNGDSLISYVRRMITMYNKNIEELTREIAALREANSNLEIMIYSLNNQNKQEYINAGS